MDTTDFKPLGKHLVRVEGDTVFVRWRGAVELSEMQELAALWSGIMEEYDRVFAISDMRNGSIPPLPVRKWIGQWLSQKRKLTAVAAFGASLPARTVILLLSRAIMLISKLPIRVSFVATEAEARQFIAEVRADRGASNS